jgi:hypothetical protein
LEGIIQERTKESRGSPRKYNSVKKGKEKLHLRETASIRTYKIVILSKEGKKPGYLQKVKKFRRTKENGEFQPFSDRFQTKRGSSKGRKGNPEKIPFLCKVRKSPESGRERKGSIKKNQSMKEGIPWR